MVAKQQFIPFKIKNLFEVWLGGQNSQSSLNPYELQTIFPFNATMQHNTKFFTWKPKPCMPLDFECDFEQKMPSSFKTIQEDRL